MSRCYVTCFVFQCLLVESAAVFSAALHGWAALLQSLGNVHVFGRIGLPSSALAAGFLVSYMPLAALVNDV